MRILQTLYDGGGGVPPQLAVTSELVSRGHEVRILAHETLRARVEDRGAELVVFAKTLPGHDMTRKETDLVCDWEPTDPVEAAARFRDLVLFGPALANAREVLGVLEALPADAIVLDWLLFGTALAAESLHLPAVALIHCPYPLRLGDGPSDAFFAPGLETMNVARGELGLAPVGTWDQQLLNVDEVLVLTAPELDPAATAKLPGNVDFVGPAFDKGSPHWSSPWPDEAADPLVLVSFSTTFMDQRDLASRVLQAVDGLAVRVLLTTGPALDVSGLTISSNVRVTDYAPHTAVLPHASLVVTHAGFGTLQAALSAGVPVVCLPTGRDQPANAARVAELGAGIAMDQHARASEIRDAITAALADAELKCNALRLGEALNRLDGVAAVADRVEALA